MSKGEYERKRRHGRTYRSKVILLMLACILLVGGVVGGTVAWLTTNTTPVENSFIATGIEVTLVETKGLNDQKKWENKMIPGVTYEKDPQARTDRSVGGGGHGRRGLWRDDPHPQCPAKARVRI